MRNAGLVVLLLSLMTPQLRAEPRIVIAGDRGGEYYTYVSRFERYDRDGTAVRVEGVCHSLCTLVTILLPNKVCVTGHAILAFHEVTEYKTVDGDFVLRGPRDERLTRELEGQYPDWVRAWLAERGGLRKGYLVMGFKELARHYPVCDTSEQRASR